MFYEILHKYSLYSVFWIELNWTRLSIKKISTWLVGFMTLLVTERRYLKHSFETLSGLLLPGLDSIIKQWIVFHSINILRPRRSFLKMYIPFCVSPANFWNSRKILTVFLLELKNTTFYWKSCTWLVGSVKLLIVLALLMPV